MKGLYFYAAIIASIFIISGMASAACNLNVGMLNQDPYPAVPDDYVKVVFQMNGTEDSDCGDIFMDINPIYPFSLDATDSTVLVKGGNFISGYPSFLEAGYKIKVDKDAVDGDNKIQVRYGKTNIINASQIKDFYINVENVRTDFDVIIQDYSLTTNVITFGIVNIGKENAEALTLEIPEQGNVKLLGNNKVIIGSLNVNDDTTATVKAMPRGEGEITINLGYNDKINVRRTLEKKVFFSGSYLEQTAARAPKGLYYYLFWAALVLFVLYFAYGYYKKSKAKKNNLKLLRNR